MKTADTTSVSMSRKYKLLVSLSARVSDMMMKFYTRASKIATLIVTLVATTKQESSKKWQHSQSTLGSVTLDIMLENIFQIIFISANYWPSHAVQ